MVFDARGEALARSDGAAPLSAEALEATGAEVRERARAGARRGYAPSGELHGRALALPIVRTPAGGNGDGPAPQAWLVAVKDRGGLGRVRPPRAAPGGHGRGARAAAPPRRRRHRAPARRRRALRDGLGRAGRLRAGAPAGAVRPARARRRARAHPAALGQGAGRGRAERRAARRGARRPGRRHGPVLLRAAAAPARRVRRRPVRARRARARARVARGRHGARRRRRPRGRRRRPAPHVPRGALRAGGPGAVGRGATATARRTCSPPTATSARSSSCSRSRTTTRCGCSATRSSPRSRTARAPTAAS